LQSIVQDTFKERKRLGLPTTADLVHVIKFILDEISPAGWLPTVHPTVEEHAVRAGFKVVDIRVPVAKQIRAASQVLDVAVVDLLRFKQLWPAAAKLKAPQATSCARPS
jgi:hypothetical protein